MTLANAASQSLRPLPTLHLPETTSISVGVRGRREHERARTKTPRTRGAIALWSTRSSGNDRYFERRCVGGERRGGPERIRTTSAEGGPDSRCSVRVLVLGHRQAADDGLRVVREPEPVNAVGGLQFAGGHERGLVVAGHDRAVDRALDAVALDRHRDLLGNGLAWAGRLVHRCIRLAATAVHLERVRTEAAD